MNALLSTNLIKCNDAASLKSVINCSEHLTALNNLGFTTNQRSPILFHIFEKFTDKDVRSRWDLTIGYRNFPTMGEFIDFLRSYFQSPKLFPLHQCIQLMQPN